MNQERLRELGLCSPKKVSCREGLTALFSYEITVYREDRDGFLMVHENNSKIQWVQLVHEKFWSEKYKYNDNNQIVEQDSQCGMQSPH